MVLNRDEGLDTFQGGGGLKEGWRSRLRKQIHVPWLVQELYILSASASMNGYWIKIFHKANYLVEKALMEADTQLFTCHILVLKILSCN